MVKLIHIMLKLDLLSYISSIVNLPEMWSPPADWISTDLPTVYRSFDNNKYVQIENGAQVVVGKVVFYQLVFISLCVCHWM